MELSCDPSVVDFDIDALLHTASSVEDSAEVQLEIFKKNICLLKSKIVKFDQKICVEDKSKSYKCVSGGPITRSQFIPLLNPLLKQRELDELHNKYDQVVEDKRQLVQKLSHYDGEREYYKASLKQYKDYLEVSQQNVKSLELQLSNATTKAKDATPQHKKKSTKCDVKKPERFDGYNFVLYQDEIYYKDNEMDDMVNDIRENLKLIISASDLNSKYCSFKERILRECCVKKKKKKPTSDSKSQQEGTESSKGKNSPIKNTKVQVTKKDANTNTEREVVPDNQIILKKQKVWKTKYNLMSKFVKTHVNINDNVLSEQYHKLMRNIERLDGIQKLLHYDDTYEQILNSPDTATDIDTVTSEDEAESIDSGLMSPLYNNDKSPITNIIYSPISEINSPKDYIPECGKDKDNKTTDVASSLFDEIKNKHINRASSPIRHLIETMDVALSPIEEINKKQVNRASSPVKQLAVNSIDVAMSPIKECQKSLSPIRELSVKTDKAPVKEYKTHRDTSSSPIRNLAVITKDVALSPIKKLQNQLTNRSSSPIKNVFKTCNVALSPIKELQRCNNNSTCGNIIPINSTDVALSPIKHLHNNITVSYEALSPIKELQQMKERKSHVGNFTKSTFNNGRDPEDYEVQNILKEMDFTAMVSPIPDSPKKQLLLRPSTNMNQAALLTNELLNMSEKLREIAKKYILDNDQRPTECADVSTFTEDGDLSAEIANNDFMNDIEVAEVSPHKNNYLPEKNTINPEVDSRVAIEVEDDCMSQADLTHKFIKNIEVTKMSLHKEFCLPEKNTMKPKVDSRVAIQVENDFMSQADLTHDCIKDNEVTEISTNKNNCFPEKKNIMPKVDSRVAIQVEDDCVSQADLTHDFIKDVEVSELTPHKKYCFPKKNTINAVADSRVEDDCVSQADLTHDFMKDIKVTELTSHKKYCFPEKNTMKPKVDSKVAIQVENDFMSQADLTHDCIKDNEVTEISTNKNNCFPEKKNIMPKVDSRVAIQVEDDCVSQADLTHDFIKDVEVSELTPHKKYCFPKKNTINAVADSRVEDDCVSQADLTHDFMKDIKVTELTSHKKYCFPEKNTIKPKVDSRVENDSMSEADLTHDFINDIEDTEMSPHIKHSFTEKNTIKAKVDSRVEDDCVAQADLTHDFMKDIKVTELTSHKKYRFPEKNTIKPKVDSRVENDSMSEADLTHDFINDIEDTEMSPHIKHSFTEKNTIKAKVDSRVEDDCVAQADLTHNCIKDIEVTKMSPHKNNCLTEKSTIKAKVDSRVEDDCMSQADMTHHLIKYIKVTEMLPHKKYCFPLKKTIEPKVDSRIGNDCMSQAELTHDLIKDIKVTEMSPHKMYCFPQKNTIKLKVDSEDCMSQVDLTANISNPGTKDIQPVSANNDQPRPTPKRNKPKKLTKLQRVRNSLIKKPKIKTVSPLRKKTCKTVVLTKPTDNPIQQKEDIYQKAAIIAAEIRAKAKLKASTPRKRRNNSKLNIPPFKVQNTECSNTSPIKENNNNVSITEVSRRPLDSSTQITSKPTHTTKTEDQHQKELINSLFGPDDEADESICDTSENVSDNAMASTNEQSKVLSRVDIKLSPESYVNKSKRITRSNLKSNSEEFEDNNVVKLSNSPLSSDGSRNNSLQNLRTPSNSNSPTSLEMYSPTTKQRSTVTRKLFKDSRDNIKTVLNKVPIRRCGQLRTSESSENSDLIINTPEASPRRRFTRSNQLFGDDTDTSEDSKILTNKFKVNKKNTLKPVNGKRGVGVTRALRSSSKDINLSKPIENDNSAKTPSRILQPNKFNADISIGSNTMRKRHTSTCKEVATKRFRDLKNIDSTQKENNATAISNNKPNTAGFTDISTDISKYIIAKDVLSSLKQLQVNLISYENLDVLNKKSTTSVKPKEPSLKLPVNLNSHEAFDVFNKKQPLKTKEPSLKQLQVNLISYEDLDIFDGKPITPVKQKKSNPKQLPVNLISNEDLNVLDVEPNTHVKTKESVLQSNKTISPKSPYSKGIFCLMLEKYGRYQVRKTYKKADKFDQSVQNLSDELETDIAEILSLHNTRPAMVALSNKLLKTDKKIFLSALVKFLTSDKRKSDVICKRYTPPAPSMTKPEQVILFVLNNMKSKCVTIIEDVLLHIEYSLFRLNYAPQFEHVEMLSHLYAVLCRCIGDKARLRIFMLDAMYCLSYKATILIQQCLDVWMNVLPLAHMNEAKSPLVVCFVYLIHFFKCDDHNNRVQALRLTLARTYFYKMGDWNQDKILQYLHNLIMEIGDSPFEQKTVRMCLIILAKRHGTHWCEKHIVTNLLFPVIEDSSARDTVREFCVSSLGAVMRPYPVRMKILVDIAISKLAMILEDKCSSSMEEAVVGSLINISKHYPARVMQLLSAWKPLRPISANLEENLKDYIREKPLTVWMKL